MPDELPDPNPLDVWSCFEVLDRSAIVAQHFDTAVASHPTVEADPELRALAEQIGDLLGTLYQRAGVLWSEAEEHPPGPSPP